MDAEQLINDMLDQAETPQEEENLLDGASLTDAARDGTYAIDFKRGRFAGKVTGEQAVIQRVIKYVLTPRGEVVVYPGSDTEDVEDDVYGSYIFGLVGEVYRSNEEVTQALQGVCDIALNELPDVQSLTVAEATIQGDTVQARIVVQLQNGTETEVAVDGIGV